MDEMESRQVEETMWRAMKTWSGKPIALVMFVFCLVLFNWPLLAVAGDRGGLAAAAYLFLSWLAVIFLLWLYGRNEAGMRSEGSDREHRS